MKYTQFVAWIGLGLSLVSANGAFAGGIKVKCISNSASDNTAISEAIKAYPLILYDKHGIVYDDDGNTTPVPIETVNFIDDTFSYDDEAAEVEDTYLRNKVLQEHYYDSTTLTIRMKPRNQGGDTTIKDYYDVQANAQGDTSHDEPGIDEGTGNWHNHLSTLVAYNDQTPYLLGVSFAYLRAENSAYDWESVSYKTGSGNPAYYLFAYSAGTSTSASLQAVCIQDLD